MTFSLQGLKESNIRLHAQTVELLSGGGISNITFNKPVKMIEVFTTGTTIHVVHVPETSEFDLYDSKGFTLLRIMLTSFYYRSSRYNLII